MIPSGWAEAGSWETVDGASTSMTMDRDLNDFIAMRDAMLENQKTITDVATLSVRDFLKRYKEVKRVVAQLLQEIDDAENKRRDIEEKLSTVRNLLMKEFYIEDDMESRKFFDKANTKSHELIKALDIPGKKAMYEEYRKVLADFQELLLEVQSQNEEPVERMCGICFDETPSHVVTPCGHVICGSCKDRLGARDRTCHACRGPVHSIIKFYL